MPAGIAAAAIVAAFAATGFSAPVQAQFYFRSWNERFVLYDDYPELIGRRGVRSILAERGYRLRGRLRRNGQVYVADVVDRRGRRFRVIVDGIEGDIVQRFQGRIPRPPARVGRRTSPTDRLDEPSVVLSPRELTPEVRRSSRKPSRKAAKPDNRRNKSRITKKPSSVIARRPLKALPEPEQAAPPIVPDKRAVSRPPAKAVSKPAEEKQANAPLLPPPDKPAPVIVPRGELDAGKPVAAPSQSGQAKSGKKGASESANLAPAADAPKVKTEDKSTDGKRTDGKLSDGKPTESKPAGNTAKTATPDDTTSEPDRKVRIVGPPIKALSAPEEKPDTRSGDAKVKVAPLDHPGQRRDVEKPVEVAPLQ